MATGNLPKALESLASSGEIIQDIRRRLVLASIYPVICLIVAYVIFCGFLTIVAPLLISSAESFPKGVPVKVLEFLYRHSRYFTMVIPAAVLTIVVVSWTVRSGPIRACLSRFAPLDLVIGRTLNWAQFTELLALQLDHKSPLPQSLILAADSTNDDQWKSETRVIAEKLVAGSTLEDAVQQANFLPPVVRWMLATGERQGTLAQTLRRLSETYRRRANRRAEIIKVWLPVFITVAMTASIGLAYSLSFVIPLRIFLSELMHE